MPVNEESDPLLSLQEQTAALAEMLKATSGSDPTTTPSEAAATAFTSWLGEAGPISRQPDYFLDVIENYIITENTSRDLWEIFDILQQYLPEPELPPWDASAKTFIGLPVLG